MPLHLNLSVMASFTLLWLAVVPSPVSLRQGEEMGRFLLGSTVVLLVPKGPLCFNPAWAPGRPIRLGEAMADAAR